MSKYNEKKFLTSKNLCLESLNTIKKEIESNKVASNEIILAKKLFEAHYEYIRWQLLAKPEHVDEEWIKKGTT